MIKEIRHLLFYLFVGFPYLMLLLPTLPWFNSDKGIKWAWLHMDMLVCSLAHDTEERTISGYTGQMALHSKRWRLQEKIIDTLASLFGDDEHHCNRSYRWELKRGVVKDSHPSE